MDWLAILALAVWVLVEHNRASNLTRQLEDLRRRLGVAPPPPTGLTFGTLPTPPAPTGITPAMEAAALAAAQAAPRPAPPPIPQPVPQPTFQPTPQPAPQPVAAAAAAPAPTIVRPPPPAAPPAPPRPPLTRARFETWLAERGLAWIGGSALVIGGAFLVGYAAQRGLFGPQMRIAAAVLLGLILLGVGEAVRRGRLSGVGGNKLVAAITSGAGAGVLYASAWAAYGLYGFINGVECAAILVGISAGLMALAFLHGQALAILALGGAFAAPLIVGAAGWSLQALTLYMAILVAAGSIIAGLRRWPGAAWANLAGVAVWSLLGLVQNDSWKCLLLGLEPLAVMTVLAYVRPNTRIGGGTGAGAVGVASFAAFLALSLAFIGPSALPEGLVAGLALPFLTAALQRRGHAAAWTLALPGAAFTLAALIGRLHGQPSLNATGLWCLQILALDAAAIWAVWKAPKGTLGSGAGALSSLALGLIAGAGVAGPLAALGPAVACAALALGAFRLAADRTTTPDRRALEIWGGGSAAAFLVALVVGLSWRWGPLGFAAATLALALIAERLKWRSVALAAAAGGVLGFLALLTAPMLLYALSGGPGAGFLLACGLAVAAASFVAARRLRGEVVAAEALRTISPLAALVGAFIFLRWLAGAKTGLPLDTLTEAGIRTLLIAVAGLVSLGRFGTDTTFGRWRGHILMGVAALHAILLQALVFNPRLALGTATDVAGGVIFLNTLAAAYLAPALVFGVAAWRTYRRSAVGGRVYALLSLGFGLIWAFLEIRRMTQGPHLAGGPLTVGPLQAIDQALVLLGLAVLADRLATRATQPTPHPFNTDAGHALSVVRWIAIAYALVMAIFWSNPWWGPAARSLGDVFGVSAVLAGYAGATLLIGRLAVDARRLGRARQAGLAGMAAMLLGVILASLIVRAVFQGADLRIGHVTSQLETWTYSAVWAAIGLAFIGVSRRFGPIFLRAGVVLLLLTTAKVFIIDTASLSGVVRAGSFIALGVLLLAGAITARRLAQAAATSAATPAPPPEPAAKNPD